MSSIVKAVFGSPSSSSPMGQKTPSFNDLSLGAHDDAHEEYTKEHPEEPESPKPGTPSSATRKNNTWAGVFNPGRNYHDNMKDVGKHYYDHVDRQEGNVSVWDHILKAERQKAFSSFDRDQDGFITADELRLKLGAAADVKQLIEAADKNGDGKIDYAEFCELLKNS